MKRYMKFDNEQQFDSILNVLIKRGHRQPHFTYRGITDLYASQNKEPAIVWYDGHKRLEFCYKEWLNDEGYVETPLNVCTMPEELFKI